MLPDDRVTPALIRSVSAAVGHFMPGSMKEVINVAAHVSVFRMKCKCDAQFINVLESS